MTAAGNLDPATLRAIADELSALADVEVRAGQGRGVRRANAAGYLVTVLGDPATELRDRALRI